MNFRSDEGKRDGHALALVCLGLAGQGFCCSLICSGFCAHLISRPACYPQPKGSGSHGSPLSVRMAVSYSESTSVFEARVKGSGLAAADGEKLLAKIKNLKQLAFISSYAPGQQDESPLMTELEGILSRKPEVAEKACFRALFHESYAVVTSEMKQRIEQTDDSSARRLTQPERAERFEKQRLKLSGVSIRGMTEPSEFLIDFCVSCYEHNELQYIAWERCTSREQEVNTGKKRDTRFSVDAATGRLKIESKGEEEKANTSSEVFVMQALQRRSLALDQANIAEYAIMQLWSDKLLRARLDEPPPGFVRPPWSQVVAADKAFFRELRDATRGGIQPGPTGARPVDACIERVAVMHEVACLLQPVHAPATRERDDSAPRPRPGPYTAEPTKGKGKGKKGQYTPRMPLQLIQWGCVPTTKKGAPYCYGHQLGTCNLPVKNNTCEKGLHACAIPKCGAHGHGASACPKRGQDKTD